MLFFFSDGIIFDVKKYVRFLVLGLKIDLIFVLFFLYLSISNNVHLMPSDSCLFIRFRSFILILRVNLLLRFIGSPFLSRNGDGGGKSNSSLSFFSSVSAHISSKFSVKSDRLFKSNRTHETCRFNCSIDS